MFASRTKGLAHRVAPVRLLHQSDFAIDFELRELCQSITGCMRTSPWSPSGVLNISQFPFLVVSPQCPDLENSKPTPLPAVEISISMLIQMRPLLRSVTRIREALAIASPLFIHTSHDSVKQLITSVRRLTVIQTLVRLSIKQSIQQS